MRRVILLNGNYLFNCGLSERVALQQKLINEKLNLRSLKELGYGN
jgi:hypothetical protein